MQLTVNIYHCVFIFLEGLFFLITLVQYNHE